MNNQTILTTALLTTLSLTTIQNSVSAASVDLTTSKPLADGVVAITVTFGGVTQSIIVDDINSTDTEQDKRAKIVLELIANGYDVDTEAQRITINNLRAGTAVGFSSVSTGEGSDGIIAQNNSAFNLFGGVFDTLDPLGELSTFLVGYSSTLGEVSLELTSDQFPDLLPETLATTFFDELVDDADLIGIDLSLDGSTISANYDTGVFGTGVQFGTTSGSGTVGGSVTLVQVPEPTSTFSLLFLGSLGAGVTLKRKLKASKPTEKVG